MKLKRQSGFTIVELIIIIVVIGILAAITVVAYTGAQERSKDSAVAGVATTVSQSARTQYETGGTYGHGGTPPASKSEALSLYNSNSLDKSVHLVGIDSSSEYGDTEKVHVLVGRDFLVIGYWSYEKDAWINVTHSSGGTYTLEEYLPPRLIL